MTTKFTITYDDGQEQEFSVSEDIEKMILAGEMFSLTTLHPDQGEQEQMKLTRVYAGNPMTALGQMISLIRILKEEGAPEDVVGPVAACMKLLSDQINYRESTGGH